MEVVISEDVKKKVEKHKDKINKFKKAVLKKFDKYVVGIEVFPLLKGEKETKTVNLFVLIDDHESKKMNKLELREKVITSVDELAKETDPLFKSETMLISDLKEAMYDAKWDILADIGNGFLIYDKGMLGALKAAELHKSMAVKKFERYILSYIAVGSLFRGDANYNDIDVFVVVDDTDVKRMPRIELKDKLRAIIQGMGLQAGQMAGLKGVQFHVQTYILTDFWESIKDANPVIFTMLRDGVPLFDRGVFMPWKLLLKMGRIKPSQEAIDMNMELGERLIQRTRAKLLSIIGEDLFYAAMNPSQAALMLYGIPPPTPKETVKLLDEIFVKKEKMLEKKYVGVLEKIRQYYKDVEHGKIKEIKGKDIDSLLDTIEDYLKRIRKLFDQIDKKREQESILNTYDTCIAITRDALFLSGEKKITVTKIDEIFKAKLVDKGLIPEKFLRILKSVIKTKKEYDKGKMSKQEVIKANKEARLFIKALVDYIQRQKSIELERAKIRFRYGKEFGEVLLLDKVAFITNNIKERDKIDMADLKNGKLANLRKSSLEEFEEHIAKIKIPANVFIKESIFEELKKLFGKNIEILVNY